MLYNDNNYIPEITFEFCDDVPEKLFPGTIYIIGEKRFRWALVFNCPCGCNDTIQLNLLRKVRPKWKFKIKKNLISVSPSIWKKSGCKSHFYIKKAKIILVKDLPSRDRLW
jgi:hypothetical protein